MKLRNGVVLAMVVGVAGWSCGVGAPAGCPSGRIACGSGCCASGQVCNAAGTCSNPCATQLCGGACCASGQICNGGTCQNPYQSAELVVYLCPDFATGNCTPNYFSLDQTCRPIPSFTRGSCYHTGFTLAPGRSYGIASCIGCPTGCGNPSAFTTPSAGFARPTYFSGTYFYCSTQCTPPADCQ